MAKRSYPEEDFEDFETNFERNYKRRNVRRSLESYDSEYEMSDEEESSSSRLNSSGEMVNFMMKTDGEHCYGCGDVINERYLLRVGTQSWHLHCLRCCVCQVALDRQHTCFIKQDHIYCKMDYARQFGAKCAKCLRNIQPTDWVRRAKEYVYHLACFACDNCKRQLSTGEEFALHDSRVLCKTHYVELIEGGPNKGESMTLLQNSHLSDSKEVQTFHLPYSKKSETPNLSDSKEVQPYNIHKAKIDVKMSSSSFPGTKLEGLVMGNKICVSEELNQFLSASENLHAICF